MGISVYTFSMPHKYNVALSYQILGCIFIKCSLCFIYVKHDKMGSRVFSITGHKIWVGLFGPAMMDLPFKLFDF